MMKEIYKEKLKKVKGAKPMETMSVERMKPSLHLSAEDLPEVKDWEVGGEYYVLLKVKQKSKEDYDNKISARFEIEEIGVAEQEDSEDDTEDED